MTRLMSKLELYYLKKFTFFISENEKKPNLNLNIKKNDL